MALCFAYQFSVLIPQEGIGSQVHIGGLVGGVLAGWVFRERRTTPSGQPGRPQKTVTSPPVDTTPTDLRRQLDDTATDYLP